MVYASKHLSKHLATLAKALESVSINLSTNLSIAAFLGLALVPLLPHHAASTFTRQASPPLATTPPAFAAPIELVRAKPVLVPDPRAQPDPALQDAPAADLAVQVAARYWRGRQRRQQQRQRPQETSGDLGKSAANAQVQKTPLAPAESKDAVAKVEPAPPDEWSDAEIIAALKDCLKRLAPLGAEIEIAPAVKHEQCGAPAPVLLKRIGSGTNRVEFQPPPMINCAMVVSLHTWIEKTLQPAAQDILGTPIVRLRGTSGYACRNRNGSRAHSDRLSEHALANAIDIMGFVTADGRTIDVATKWGPTARDIREQKDQTAEATVAAKQAEKEAAEAAKAAAKKEPGSKRERAKAEAARKKEEAERRMQEEAEQKEAEQRKIRERGSSRTAELQKLGKGVDPKADAQKASAQKASPQKASAQKANEKAIPTTAATNDTSRNSAEAAFLRRLHKGACTAFGTVLGPEANEAHRDHFHFDLAPRRRTAFCE